jgi:hypothetical protein
LRPSQASVTAQLGLSSCACRKASSPSAWILRHEGQQPLLPPGMVVLRVDGDRGVGRLPPGGHRGREVIVVPW